MRRIFQRYLNGIVITLILLIIGLSFFLIKYYSSQKSILIAENNNCPTTFNADYKREIVTEKSNCKITMFTDNGNADFSIIYPKKWVASIVGAAASNIKLEKNAEEIVHVIQTSTNLSLNEVHNSNYCYEGCNPILDYKEVIISKSNLTIDSKHILKLITSIESKPMERYFYLTDQKQSNNYRLLIFEFTPSDQDFENEVLELIKNTEFSIK